MALTLNPATKVFTIAQADLTFVSGTLYNFDTNQFRKDAFDLLASESYIWMADAYDHNQEYTVLGVTYFRKVEWINGFSIQFEDTGSAYSVNYLGSNNNLFDIENGILIPTPLVTTIGTNSAGNQTILSGSGLDAAQDAKLTSIDTRTAYHDKVINNYKELIKIASSWYLVIYDDGEISGGTEILRKKMEDSTGADISDLAAGVLAAELESTA